MKETEMNSGRAFAVAIVTLVVAVGSLVACARPEPAPTAASAPTEVDGPKLSTELIRGCQRSRSPGQGGPAPGELAIDFALKDVGGKEYTLSRLLMEKPVVMIFGSFT